MNEKNRIAIIDDDPSIRRSLMRMLSNAGYDVVAFANAGDFLTAIDAVGSERFSCVVSDLRMPGADGLELQQALRARLPDLSVVFITGHGNVPATASAMKAGAVDFLEKPVRRRALLEAVNRAIARTQQLSAASTETDELRIRYKRLSPRESEVLPLVAAGLLNKQIAAELGAAEKTIKQHRGRVMLKMEAESLAELVLMAERLGVRPSNKDFNRAKGRLNH